MEGWKRLTVANRREHKLAPFVRLLSGSMSGIEISPTIASIRRGDLTTLAYIMSFFRVATWFGVLALSSGQAFPQVPPASSCAEDARIDAAKNEDD